MYPLFSPSRLLAAGLLLALAACGGKKDQVYIEKPVDDLYNKAMDAMLEENYAAPRRHLMKSMHSIPIRHGLQKAS